MAWGGPACASGALDWQPFKRTVADEMAKTRALKQDNRLRVKDIGYSGFKILRLQMKWEWRRVRNDCGGPLIWEKEIALSAVPAGQGGEVVSPLELRTDR